MKKLLVSFLFALALLTGCEPYYGADPYVALDSASAAIQRTEQAAGTALADRAYQERMQANQATETAQANANRLTEIALEATLTEDRARSTAVANQTATAVEADRIATEEARSLSATKEAAEVHTYQTQQAIVARSQELELEREETWNAVKAAAPWVLGAITVLAIIGLSVIGVIHEARQPKSLSADERGDKPLQQLTSGDRVTYYDPDLNPTGVMQYDRKTGEVTYPLLLPRNWQAEHSERDQMIEMVHRGLPRQAGAATTARQVMDQMLESARASKIYKIFGPHERPAPAHLPDETLEMLDAEWKEVQA